MHGEPIARMTDEELALLSADHPVVVQPFLSAHDQQQRDILVTAAGRALVAHGARVSTNGGLIVPDHIVDLLQVRQDARRVLALVTTRVDVEHECVRYLHDLDGSWLVEQVSTAGMHDFRLLSGTSLRPYVLEVLSMVCADVPRTDAQSVDPARLSREATVRIDIALWSAAEGAGTLVGVLGGVLGLWRTTESAGTAKELSFVSTDASSLCDDIVALLAADSKATTDRSVQ